MADQIGEVPAEAGPVEEVGDVVALGPAFAMLALAPAEVQAAPHGWEEVDNDDHLDGDLLVGTDWMQEDNLWGNLPEVKTCPPCQDFGPWSRSWFRVCKAEESGSRDPGVGILVLMFVGC